MRMALFAVVAVLAAGAFGSSDGALAQGQCRDGFIPHPHVADECYPADRTPCLDGGYCDVGQQCLAGGGCAPMGAVDCGGGRYCDAGEQCMTGGGCMPLGNIDCGDGTFCPSDNRCGASGCVDD